LKAMAETFMLVLAALCGVRTESDDA